MKKKLNSFNLSHSNGLTLRIGEIVPIFVDHLVPGDKFEIDTYLASRFFPMQAPIMTNVDIKTWAFAVPYRLVWEDYKEFFTGKNKRGDDVDPTFPRVDYSGLRNFYEQDIEEAAMLVKTGTLSDYLDLPNIPVNSDSDEWASWYQKLPYFPSCSVLEPRAYQLIYNEWFRDQNIDDPVEFGIDSYIYDFASSRAENEWQNLMTLRKLRWSKDYFTSALPTPSLAPDVALPVDSGVNYIPSPQGGLIRTSEGQTFEDDQNNLYAIASNTEPQATSQPMKAGSSNRQNNVAYDPNGTLRANDNATTIRDLTYSRMIYQYLLDLARGGSIRYKDFVKTLFGVTLPDYRAEIPEYIGGGQQPVIVSEVLQTSETNETPQGNISGRAVSVGSNHHAYYKAKEHTIIMILACVMPRPSYMSGLPKRHFKFDRFEYFIPQFDHVGDQEIKRKELSYYDNTVNDETFGYAPRYSEYKSAVNRVHGELRNTLAYWTMARDFSRSTPFLSPQFLVPEKELIERPFFVQSDGRYKPEQLTLECSFNINANRPMSKYSTPIV